MMVVIRCMWIEVQIMISGDGMGYNSFILFRRTMQSENNRQKQYSQKQQKQKNQLPASITNQSVIYLRKQVGQIMSDLTNINPIKWKQLLSHIKPLDILQQNNGLLHCSLQLLQNLQLQQLTQTNSSKVLEFKPKQQDYLLYLLRATSIRQCDQQSQIWKSRQFYLEGEQLLKHLNSLQLWHSSLNKQSINQILLLNRLHYCLKFDLLQKALQTVQLLNVQIDRNAALRQYVQAVNDIILMRMGCNIQPQQKALDGTETHSCYVSEGEAELCMRIISLTKQTLPQFIQTIRNQQIQISAQNLYNLALVYRKFKYLNEAAQILCKLTDRKKNKQQSRFHTKCLSILSQVYEQSGSLSEALAVLQQIQVYQYRDVMQWEYRKLILTKKIKLQKAAKSCPLFTQIQTKKLYLISGLQNELNELINDNHKINHDPKRKTSKLYESIKSVRNMKKIDLPNLTTFKFRQHPKTQQLNNSNLNTHISTLNTHKYKNSLSTNSQTSNQFNFHLKKPKENIKTSQDKTIPQQINSRQNIETLTISRIDSSNYNKQQSRIIEDKPQPTVIELTQKQQIVQLRESVPFQQQYAEKVRKYKQPKKTVKFSQQGNEKVHDIIYEGEEKITNLFLCEDFSQIESQIRSTLLQLQSQPSCTQINKFIIKCAKWYRQIGKDHEAISLLNTTISKIEFEKDREQFKKDCLKILGQIYHELNDSKNAIKVYLQLANLGIVQYYDKLGELSMLKQRYSESIKYYEMFNNLKQSIYSKSKLAHAYSKLPIYKKKAVDMLNQILFQNKNSLIFRHFCFEQIQDVQKAVLLLVSIYMKIQSGMHKAKMICQQFLQINFSAYPIYYMLGIMYQEEGRKEDAFNAFLTALKLKPNHIPSLIKIVNDIGIQNGNNYEIINILRKAYVLDNRNWQLLKLLIQSITLIKQEENKPSVQQLVRYAKILEKAQVSNGDMDLQIEMVWVWAFEVIESRRRKEQIVQDDNQNEINMRLGEINMVKGNFKVSEFYLKKVLAKIQQRRKRTQRRRGGKMKLQFEALQRLSYIKTRQSQTAEIKSILGGTLNIDKDEIEEKQTILKTMISSGRL